MSKLYRCVNPECSKPDKGGRHLHDFWSDEPVCDSCGADSREPDGFALIHPLVIIHFDELVRMGQGKNTRACDPSRRIHSSEGGEHGGTCDVGSVTCRKCKETEAYQAAKLNEGA